MVLFHLGNGQNNNDSDGESNIIDEGEFVSDEEEEEQNEEDDEEEENDQNEAGKQFF